MYIGSNILVIKHVLHDLFDISRALWPSFRAATHPGLPRFQVLIIHCYLTDVRKRIIHSAIDKKYQIMLVLI